MSRCDGAHAEGLGYGYLLHEVEVHTDGGNTEQVAVYLAQDGYINSDLKPFTWYLDICLCGARQHDLPAEYISIMETIPSIPDPDAERAAENQALLDGIS